MPLRVLVVEVSDELEPLLHVRDASVEVEEVGLVVVDQVLVAEEPVVAPRLRGVARKVGPFRVFVVRRAVERLVRRVGTVVRYARERTFLVAAAARVEPAWYPVHMRGRAEPQAVIERSLFPESADVSLRSDVHRVPPLVR